MMKSFHIFLVILFLNLFALFACIASGETKSAPFGRGWNDNIQWKTLEEGKKEAKEKSKPMMIIIHSTSCGACKRLKPLFAGSKQIEELSAKFVMVNLEDKEAPPPEQQEFYHDGGYVPRIYFADFNGAPRHDIFNKATSMYKYFYSKADQIVEVMEQALEVIKPSGEL